ncbi:unnamed protein product [Rotaria sp. Silwood1]|nr:unnamed protein product [Rotaria sp. Silwood1]
MLTSDSELDSSRSIDNEKSRKYSRECRICGAPAEYRYFGIIACTSCKTFFKRNANSTKIRFKCDNNDQCKININNHHICTSCRLAKCFQCGMSTDMFRAPRQTKPKSISLVIAQIKDQPEREILQSDRSLLTTDQWTLLSNLFHIYNESQLSSIGQCLIDTSAVLQSTNISCQSLMQEFLTCIYETTGTYLRFNDDLRKLSFDNRSITLSNVANNVSCLDCAFVVQNFHLFALEIFSNTLEVMYGKPTVDIYRWTMKFIDLDIVLIKLALSLFAFSGNTCSYSPNISTELTDPIIILEIQNKYAEITWKYLLYRYGHYQAVQRFLNIISWLEALTIFVFHTQNLTTYINEIDLLAEQTELTLILDDIDQILPTN